jgi:hypothetical protein
MQHYLCRLALLVGSCRIDDALQCGADLGEAAVGQGLHGLTLLARCVHRDRYRGLEKDRLHIHLPQLGYADDEPIALHAADQAREILATHHQVTR